MARKIQMPACEDGLAVGAWLVEGPQHPDAPVSRASGTRVLRTGRRHRPLVSSWSRGDAY